MVGDKEGVLKKGIGWGLEMEGKKSTNRKEVLWFVIVKKDKRIGHD